MTLTVRRIIRASPERLFKAWTQPRHLMQWWGPRDVRCDPLSTRKRSFRFQRNQRCHNYPHLIPPPGGQAVHAGGAPSKAAKRCVPQWQQGEPQARRR